MTTQAQTQIPFPPIQEIKDFFFDASIVGYASGLPRIVLTAESLTAFGTQDTQIRFPILGTKFYQHRRDKFIYIDMYFVGGDGFSSGWTMIWHAERPVWFMSYQGQCIRKAAIPFLKNCLRDAYSDSEFHGGRGKSDTRVGNFAYFNHWEGEFANFHGRDKICEYGSSSEASAKEIYYHSYQGLLLIPTGQEEKVHRYSPNDHCNR